MNRWCVMVLPIALYPDSIKVDLKLKTDHCTSRELIANILIQQFAVRLPDDQVEDLWLACKKQLQNEGLIETLAHIEQTQARDPAALDTLERSDLQTALAMVLIQKDWPTQGEFVCGQAKDFVRSMVDGMKERSYTPTVGCSSS